MKIRLLALALIAMNYQPALATEVTYNFSGTFVSQSGSIWSALSGGSFTGTFVAPDGAFPLPPATISYLDSFEINIYTASGTLFSTLSSNVPGSYEYFTNDYVSIYGGEQLGFLQSGTDYLAVVVPTTFDGSGAIIPAPAAASYAEVGPNYAYIATGNIVASVPEPSTWVMMILGFAGLGFLASRRRGRTPINAA